MSEKKIYFGPSQPCFIIAEIGANHNGELDLCLRTMEAAASTGVNALKLQYYSARDLVADVDRVWAWGPRGGQTRERIGDMFDRLSLSKEELARAYAFADTLGIPLFCTPFSVQGVKDLEALGNPIYKIASSDISFYPMLDAINNLHKPVILSTGKCPMEDVLAAISHLSDIPSDRLGLLHCIAQYPAPFDEMNIRVVQSFQGRFKGHPIGLSDHCTIHEPALASVALGGCIIEKHFTLDHDLVGPDHWFSMNPAQARQLVESVRTLEAALGDGHKGIAQCEQSEATYSRRSIIVMKNVAKGQAITADHLAMLRPGTGLHPRHWDEVVGQKASRDLRAREPLTWGMIEGQARPDIESPGESADTP